MSVANSKSLQLSCWSFTQWVEPWLVWRGCHESGPPCTLYISVLHLFSQFSHMIALDAGPQQRSWRCIYLGTPLPWFTHLQLWSSTAIRNNSESFLFTSIPMMNQEAYKGEIQCTILLNQIFFLTNHNKFRADDIQLLLFSNQNTVVHRK